MSKITVTDMGSQSPSLSSNRMERINVSKGAGTSGEGNPEKAESGRGSLDKPRAEGYRSSPMVYGYLLYPPAFLRGSHMARRRLVSDTHLSS